MHEGNPFLIFNSRLFYMIFISITLHFIHVTCSIMSRRSFLETMSISPVSFCQTKTLTWNEMIDEWHIYSLDKTGRRENVRKMRCSCSRESSRQQQSWFSVKWETHMLVGGRRGVWVCTEPGVSRLAMDGGRAEHFELRNQNVRLSWWVIRLYKSPPQHTSGPLFSLSLRGSQETSSPATVR